MTPGFFVQWRKIRRGFLTKRTEGKYKRGNDGLEEIEHENRELI